MIGLIVLIIGVALQWAYCYDPSDGPTGMPGHPGKPLDQEGSDE